MDVERGNRLVKLKSWANWLAPDDSFKCLTLHCFSLNGTKTKIGDDVATELMSLTDMELKILTVEMVTELNQYCYSVSKLNSFGFGTILDKVKAEISVAFVSTITFEDHQDRMVLNLFFNEKMHDEPLEHVQNETESESLDSMDSCRFYVERLCDYFEK